MSPKLTVLMTVYNVEKYIRRAVFSILNQTFREFELIIINDGSTDRTEAIISSFKDKRIRYYKNEQNLGISISLNKGIALTNGKYAARMDGDDICYPNRLGKQMAFLDQHEDHGLAGSWYYVINNNGSLRTVRRKDTEDENIRLSMLFENQFIQSSVMMRTDLLKEIRYDPELEVCEDYDLFMKIMGKSKVANIPEELITYRWHGKNTSIVKQKSILESFLKIFSRTLDAYNIPHTTEELFIHGIIAFRYAKRYFDNDERIHQLDNWLNKIQISPKIIASFDKEAINKKLKQIKEMCLGEILIPIDL